VCGPRAIIPNSPGVRTRFRSLDPPKGLPTEFSHVSCPDEQAPGEVVSVRRTGTDEDDVHLEPIESVGQWLGMAGIVGGVAGVIAALLVGIKEAWAARRFQRRMDRRGEQPPAF